MINCKACNNELAKGVKKCPHCGKELNITMFGIRKVYRKDKEYRCRASWCKICTAEASKQRYRNKVLEQLMDISPNK